MFREQTKNSEQQNAEIPKSAYSFVEQYTLVSKDRLLFDYSLFFWRKKIPAAYEGEPGAGFYKSVELPNELSIRDFIAQTSLFKTDSLRDKKARTISIITLAPGKKIYLYPNINIKNFPEFFMEFDDKNEKAWPLYVTPEINRAIVEQLKLHTRGTR